METRFQELREEILKRMKDDKAYAELYKRAYMADNFDGLMKVFTDNFGWACKNRVLTPDFIKEYRKDFADAGIWCNVDRESGFLLVENAEVKASGSTYVAAWDNATVEAQGNATVEAWENATVKAWNDAMVVAWDEAKVEAWDNATVDAWGNAMVDAWGNAMVVAWGNAKVDAWENAKVIAWGNATVVAQESTTVVARENATVKTPG